MIPKPTKTSKKKVRTPTPEGPKVCVGCGTAHNLSIHHVYNKSARDFSSENECVEWVCYEEHQGTYGIHGTYHDQKLNSRLKKKHQRRLEAEGMTREEFIYNVGRNYL